MRRWFFTSESVTEGHPDKVADRISDSVLDAVLEQDGTGRVACEALVTKNLAVVGGEVSARADVDVAAVTRKAIADIGYVDDPEFSADLVDVDVRMHRQSEEIAAGVTRSLEARRGSVDPLDVLGAGDQGLMFGYATDETDVKMPLPIHLAHRLAERLTDARKTGALTYLRPDAKTQVTVEYLGDRPVRVARVLISTQHSEAVSGPSDMEPDLWEQVLHQVVPHDLLDETELLVNPSGRFLHGGPAVDTGLTGRKIIVDTYGGFARHGGGAFSGKDGTKVDRSAAYAARHAAKTVVAAGLARRCELQLAYAIGKAAPFSVYVETFGTSTVEPAALERLVREFFDFRPAAIIARLGLDRPIFTATSSLGHFGRELPDFAWESTELAGDLARAAADL